MYIITGGCLHLQFFYFSAFALLNLFHLLGQLFVIDSLAAPQGEEEDEVFNKFCEVKGPLDFALHQMKEV